MAQERKRSLRHEGCRGPSCCHSTEMALYKAKKLPRVMLARGKLRSSPWGSWGNLLGSTGHSKSRGIELPSTAESPTTALELMKGKEPFLRVSSRRRVGSLEVPGNSCQMTQFTQKRHPLLYHQQSLKILYRNGNIFSSIRRTKEKIVGNPGGSRR